MKKFSKKIDLQENKKKYLKNTLIIALRNNFTIDIFNFLIKNEVKIQDLDKNEFRKIISKYNIDFQILDKIKKINPKFFDKDVFEWGYLNYSHWRDSRLLLMYKIYS